MEKNNPKNNIGNHGNITKGDYKFIHGSILAKIWPPWLEGGMGPKSTIMPIFYDEFVV